MGALWIDPRHYRCNFICHRCFASKTLGHMSFTDFSAEAPWRMTQVPESMFWEFAQHRTSVLTLLPGWRRERVRSDTMHCSNLGVAWLLIDWPRTRPHPTPPRFPDACRACRKSWVRADRETSGRRGGRLAGRWYHQAGVGRVWGRSIIGCALVFLITNKAYLSLPEPRLNDLLPNASFDDVAYDLLLRFKLWLSDNKMSCSCRRFTAKSLNIGDRPMAANRWPRSGDDF